MIWNSRIKMPPTLYKSVFFEYNRKEENHLNFTIIISGVQKIAIDVSDDFNKNKLRKLVVFAK